MKLSAQVCFVVWPKLLVYFTLRIVLLHSLFVSYNSRESLMLKYAFRLLIMFEMYYTRENGLFFHKLLPT